MKQRGHFVFLSLILAQAAPAVAAPVGQAAYTTPGSYQWVAPAGVTSVNVVAVGGGSRAGGGLGRALDQCAASLRAIAGPGIEAEARLLSIVVRSCGP